MAALQRTKRLPDIKKLMSNQTSRKRQSWRQQLAIFSEWAARKNAYEAAKAKALAEEKMNGG